MMKMNPRVYQIMNQVYQADNDNEYREGRCWQKQRGKHWGEKKEKIRKEEKLPDGLPIPDSTPGFCLCPMRTLVNFQYFPFTC